ncbi:MAG TPA: IS1595 family transposase [Telluria sp.]|nr:IS1595 family transposase [Telluria sp.]
MRAHDFRRLLERVGTLSPKQRAKLADALREGDEADQAVRLIESARASHLACPRCSSTRFHRHGYAHGLQRFRCCTCGKTFNSLTGTPMAWLHYKYKWLRYSDCLLASSTIRQAARRCVIHKSTSFRWRHRFLALPKTDRPRCLHGITEADEMYFLESEKGARQLDRPPRRRGGAASKRGISSEQVCVLVARDRTGQTLDFVTGKGPVTKAQLIQCLPRVIDKDVLLVTDSHASYRFFAQDLEISHRAVNLRAGVRVKGAIHIQNVNAYHSRFRAWIYRFHGVATRYLPSYLGWRWILDAKRVRCAEALLRSAVGSFPHFSGT